MHHCREKKTERERIINSDLLYKWVNMNIVLVYQFTEFLFLEWCFYGHQLLAKIHRSIWLVIYINCWLNKIHAVSPKIMLIKIRDKSFFGSSPMKTHHVRKPCKNNMVHSFINFLFTWFFIGREDCGDFAPGDKKVSFSQFFLTAYYKHVLFGKGMEDFQPF